MPALKANPALTHRPSFAAHQPSFAAHQPSFAAHQGLSAANQGKRGFSTPKCVKCGGDMAEGFIPGLASWLDQLCDLPVVVGGSGKRLLPGTVTIAPSGLVKKPAQNVASAASSP